jgi:hypothetical protein
MVGGMTSANDTIYELLAINVGYNLVILEVSRMKREPYMKIKITIN